MQGGPSSLFTSRNKPDTSPASVVRGGPKNIKDAGGFVTLERQSSQEFDSVALQAVKKPSSGTSIDDVEPGIRHQEYAFAR